MLRHVVTSNNITVRRNFHAKRSGIIRALAPVVSKYGEEVYILTYNDLPKKSFFLAENLKLNFTRAGRYPLNFVVGWYARDFISQGRNFYAPYVMLGTYKMAGRPSLGVALRTVTPRFKRAVGTAIARFLTRG